MMHDKIMIVIQVRLSKKGQNHFPNSYFISDIHRVRTNPEKHVDVKIEPQEGTRPTAICSSNFLM